MESEIKYTEEEVEIPVKVKRNGKTKHSDSKPLRERANDLMSQQRFWATLAHAMGPVMVLGAIFGDGLSWLGPILITAGIFLYYSERSEYVKYHARQALVMQLAGSIGWFVVLFSGVALWAVLFIISLLLIIVLIGIVLAPLMLLLLPVFMLATLALPVSAAIFGAIGAVEVWHGRNFSYPFVGKWLDKKYGQPYKSQDVTYV